MKKAVKMIWCTIGILVLFCIGTFAADKCMLRNELIRLHVIANSDSEHDQNVKLAVRDTVVRYLQESMGAIENANAAQDYLLKHMDELTEEVHKTLVNLGEPMDATVVLGKVGFDRRDYKTFSLPAGIYNTLQVCIGKAEGENWWCVAFPSLCLPASTEGFTQAAVAAGMNDGLAASLADNSHYTVRFYILDCFGKLERYFFDK